MVGCPIARLTGIACFRSTAVRPLWVMNGLMAAISHLLDHFVGASEHRGRYFEAKRLCREIGRFLSLENAIYIPCSEPLSSS